MSFLGDKGEISAHCWILLPSGLALTYLYTLARLQDHATLEDAVCCQGFRFIHHTSIYTTLDDLYHR